VREAHLIVNATPVGMRPGSGSPISTEWLGAGQVVLDMVYGTPSPTDLVIGALERGSVAIDGLGMLVAQGATAIDIWNAEAQLRTPRDVMRRAALQQLAKHNHAEVTG